MNTSHISRGINRFLRATSRHRRSSTASAIQPMHNYPIDFDTASSIIGQESHVLMVQIEPGQTLRAETGAMLFMTAGIEMTTSLGGADGVSSAFKRMLTQNSIFVSDFTYSGTPGTSGTVGLGTDFPSKIIRFSLKDYDGKIVCQKGTFLAGTADTEIGIEFAKSLMSGFFGGEGFVLQSLVGHGDVFCKAGGTLIRKDLKVGETIRISTGSLVAFTQNVKYDVQVMPGFKNVLFGGEGLFVTTLLGPGTIWLQGLSPDKMISEIIRRIPSTGIPIGVPIPLGGDSSTNSTSDGSMETPTPLEDQTTPDPSTINNFPSHVDSDSPSALFGDSVSTESGSKETLSTSFDETSSENIFNDKDEDFIEKQTLSTKDIESPDGDFSEENSESFNVENTESDQDHYPVGIFQKIWDFFRGDD